MGGMRQSDSGSRARWRDLWLCHFPFFEGFKVYWLCVTCATRLRQHPYAPPGEGQHSQSRCVQRHSPEASHQVGHISREEHLNSRGWEVLPVTSVANTSHPCAALLNSLGVKGEVRGLRELGSLSSSHSFFPRDERCPVRTSSLLGRQELS